MTANRRIAAIFLLAMTVGALVPSPTSGSPIRKVAQELAEYIGKKFGREGVQELATLGGKEAVEELLERSTKEGGDALVSKVVSLTQRQGPIAIRVLRLSPKAFADALDGMPDDVARSALRATERDPLQMTKIVQNFGQRGLLTEVKHPGVGASLVSKLGDDGLAISERVTTDQAITLTRYADDIARLPAGDKATAVAALQKAPARIVEFLERNPKFMITAATVGTLVAVSDKALAPTVITEYGPDGKPIRTTSRGPADTVSQNAAWPMATVVLIVAIPLAGAMLLWLLVRVYWSWIRNRNRALSEASKTPSPGEPSSENSRRLLLHGMPPGSIGVSAPGENTLIDGLTDASKEKVKQ